MNQLCSGSSVQSVQFVQHDRRRNFLLLDRIQINGRSHGLSVKQEDLADYLSVSLKLKQRASQCVQNDLWVLSVRLWIMCSELVSDYCGCSEEAAVGAQALIQRQPGV